MTRWGVGPRWVALSALFAAPAIAARLLWPGVFRIPCVPRPVVVVAGLVLLGLGLPLCVAGVVRLARGFPKGELFTSGAYALCRHPIYGSWIVFGVPGMALLADSWIGLLVPGAMYAALRVLVREEEAWLDSCERWYGSLAENRVLDFTGMAAAWLLYRSEVFDRDLWLAGKIRHEVQVQEYFMDRPQDLLIIDICGGEGWARLLPFLATSLGEFPRENVFPREDVFPLLPAVELTDGV